MHLILLNMGIIESNWKNMVTTMYIDIIYLWHWDNQIPNGERI